MHEVKAYLWYPTVSQARVWVLQARGWPFLALLETVWVIPDGWRG